MQNFEPWLAPGSGIERLVPDSIGTTSVPSRRTRTTDIPAGRTRSSDRALPQWSKSRSRWRAVPFGSIDVANHRFPHNTRFLHRLERLGEQLEPLHRAH